MGRFVSNHYPFMLTCKTDKKRHFLTYHPKEEKPAILNLSMSKRRRFYCPHLTLVPGRKHYCQKGKKHGHATLSPQNWYNLLSSSQDICVLCIPPASQFVIFVHQKASMTLLLIIESTPTYKKKCYSASTQKQYWGKKVTLLASISSSSPRMVFKQTPFPDVELKQQTCEHLLHDKISNDKDAAP